MAFNAFGSTNTFGGAAKPTFGFGSTSPNTNSGFGGFNKPATTGFGAPSAGGFGATNTFGGSSFGQPAASNTFGSPSTGNTFNKSFSTTTNLGGLGGSTGAFGSSPGGGFGASAFGAKPAGSPSTPFGGGGGFGASSQTLGGGGGAFGGGAFGNPAGGNTFGSSAFGAPAATNAFGAPAANASPFGAAASAFGGGGNTAFGSSAAPAFGAASGAPAFGASAAPAFGSSAAPAFGSAGTSAFGGGGNAFGAAATTQPGAMGGGFGGGAFGSGSAFGQPAAAATNAFGSPGLGGGAFGVGGAGGAAATGFGQAASSSGTGNPKFSPLPIQETVNKAGHNQVTTLSLQVISGMTAYNTKSMEELRFEDYQRGNKTGNAIAGGGGGAFGLGSASSASPFGQPAAGGAFGGNAFGAPAAAPAASNPFGGGGTTSAFGASSAPAFGSAFGSTAAPAFGAAAAPAFGAPATSGFGSNAFGSSGGSSFGSLGGVSSSTGSAFGSGASTPFGGSTFGSSAFGASNATPAAAPAFGSAFGGGGGAFGQQQPQNTSFGAAPAATSGFSFGSTNTAAAPAFGAPAANASAFGQPNTAGTGGLSFGGGGAFGTTSGANTAGGGMFGTKPTTSFGGATATPSFSFGAAAAAPAAGTSGFSFGQNTTSSNCFGIPATGGTLGSMAPATGGMFGSLSGTGTGGGFTSSFGPGGCVPSQQASALPSSFGFTAAPSYMTGLSNQQQMTQYQYAAAQQKQILQQQQQASAEEEQRSLSAKIDLLKRKKDGLTTSKTTTALKSVYELPETDNTFLGFTGINTLKPASKSPPDSPVVPRGWKDVLPRKEVAPRTLLLAPIEGLDDGNSSASGGLSNRNFLSMERALIVPAGATSPSPSASGLNAVGRYGSKLQLALYQQSGEDPLGDLPPPQYFTSNRSTGKKEQKTSSSSNGADFTPAKSFGGEATGLTPRAAVVTPLASSSNANATSFAHEGEEVYQRDIAFQANEQDRLLSPVTPLYRQNEEPSSTPPSLTKPGYFTSPAMNVLCSMTDSDLKRVRDFTVFRPNFGSILWRGETDVRDLDLDTIVRIDKKEVFVYEGMETPPLGKQLNKTAVITLNNVFPKEGSSDAKKQAYVQKLYDFCATNDATFIDYSLVTGDWVFEVKHFSRYGLEDSDDEDEPQPSATAAAAQTPAAGGSSVPMDAVTPATPSENVNRLRSYLLTKSPGAVAAAAAASTPSLSTHTPRRYGVSSSMNRIDTTPSYLAKRPAEDDQHLYPSEGFSPKVLFDKDTAFPADQNQHQLMNLEVTTVTPSEPLIPSLRDLRTRDDLSRSLGSSALFPIKNSPCFQIMQEVKAAVGKSLGVTAEAQSSFTKTSLQPQSTATALRRGMTDYGLSMSRSFRVGWSADGRIVHSGKLLFAPNDDSYGRSHRVVVESVDTVRWAGKKWGGGEDSSEDKENNNAASDRLCQVFGRPLEALLTNSHQEALKSSASSSFSTSSATPGFNHPLTLAAGRVPLWMVPRADPTELHEYILFLKYLKETTSSYRHGRFPSSHPDWFACKALELLDATYGQERLTISSNPNQRALDLMPQYEDRPLACPPELWERRRTALSNWLESLTDPFVDSSSNVDSGSFGQTAPTFKRIFELLSCRRIDDAVRVAENAGMFRLSTLLSQLDGDASIPTLMRHQLELWRGADADKTIPPELLRIYRLLAGSVVVEDESGAAVTESIVQGLGWVRAIGILFWYCSKNETFFDTVGTLSGALESYRLCGSDLVDPPVSTYVTDTDPLGANVLANVKHGLYHLLELLFPSPSDTQQLTEAELNADLTRKIVACLLPGGYTRDALDYRTSYLILTLLEGAGVADECAPYAGIVRQHLIFQLLSCGLWQWAVFVALQLKDANARYSLSRDIVLRFAGCNEWELADDHSVEKFLSKRLNIPDVWIHEATAYRHGCRFDRSRQAVYLNLAKQWNQAKEVLCVYVAPRAILASSSAASEVLKLLELVEEEEQRDGENEGRVVTRHTNSYSTLSAIFVSFLRLRDFVESVKDGDLEVIRRDDEMVIDSKLNEILDEAKELLNRLASYQINQAVHQEAGSESVYGTAVVYDMSSYLYKLVSKLVALSSPSGGQQNGNELLTLVSEEYLHSLPVHGSAVSHTLSNVGEDHLHAAAHRLMSVN